MVPDKLEEFSDSQGAITASAISTNVMDLGASPTQRDPGPEPPSLVVQVDVTGTGAGTLTIALVSDSTADLATAPIQHLISPAFVGTDMVAGKTLMNMKLPANGYVSGTPPAPANYKRYLGLKYTISGTVGAVKLSAFLTRDPQNAPIFPSSVVVG